MRPSPFAAFARPRFIGLVAALGLVSSAQAAFVQGDWDPPYGSPFADLGWEGTVVIEVADACLSLADGLYVDGASCAASSVFDAKVRFYNLMSPSTILETLDFTAAVQVSKILVQDGEVTQFEVVGTDKVASTIPEARPGASPLNAYFSLDVSLDVDAGARIATLSWYAQPSESDPRGTNRSPALVSFSPFGTGTTSVSAPGTLALAAAAVGLLGALRRRG